MNNEQFSVPQRQSEVGIILIFFNVIYQIVRRAWPLLFILFSKKFTLTTLLYIGIALVLVMILGAIYSYLFYRNFRFHFDFEKQRFILEKGVFSSQIVEIPLDKIQQVDIKRSIIQRIFGVYSLSIDTAGSKKDEVTVHAITQEKAQAFSKLLTTQIQHFSEEKPVDKEHEGSAEVTNPPVGWSHRLGILNLFKIGLTQSYLRGFLIILVFLSTVYSQIEDYFESYLDQFLDVSQEYYDTVSQSVISMALLVFVVLILSILVTIGRVIIKHFDLKIVQTASKIEVEMGLKTNTKVSFQARRLQLLKIVTNPIQKKINLYEAQMALASSEDDIGKSKIIVPGLTRDLIQKINDFLYTADNSSRRDYRPHKAWINRRVLMILGAFVLIWTGEVFINDMENWQNILIATFIAIFFIIPYQFFVYKSIQLDFSNEFLKIQSGLWTQKTEILELYKLQGVTTKQPFWYRRRNIHNLTFHTAAGDLTIRAVPAVLLQEVNHLLYKVESTKKAWM